jgi:hypothetical protein
MVFAQILGGQANTLNKPTGKNSVARVINSNLDIKAAIAASMKKAKAKTAKKRDLARQKAILKAMARNLAFRQEVRTALIAAVSRRG